MTQGIRSEIRKSSVIVTIQTLPDDDCSSFSLLAGIYTPR